MDAAFCESAHKAGTGVCQVLRQRAVWYGKTTASTYNVLQHICPEYWKL